ncbi:30S ribosomal protein S17 [Candidatus Woesearchaeota archaeon]|nr:30S ribosomal protein S17 [Candidatus Woesearchaeota archaeon]
MKAPQHACEDKKCPFHGGLAVKKELLTGAVVRKDVNHTATISWFNSSYVPKYERFEQKRSRLRVHNPPCINAEIGDNVVVAKTRPLSKTKNFVIIGTLAGKSKKVLLAEESVRQFHKKKEEKLEESTAADHLKHKTKE